jgi:Carboxypeptidase regulatory-like domain
MKARLCTALIEKVRTVVTDSQGQYKIVALPPGVYSVTFSLAGFNSIKRSGIDLTTNFTANVNGALQVGDLQETVNVSAATPVVDVQNVREQRTLTADVVAAVPTGRTDETIAVLIPGALITPNATTLSTTCPRVGAISSREHFSPLTRTIVGIGRVNNSTECVHWKN